MNTDTNDIVITSEEDAKAVRDALLKLLATYEVVSFSDFLELVGLSSTFTDTKIGWIELNDVPIQPLKGGYVLMLPDPMPIGISVARNAEDAKKEDERIELIRQMKLDKDRGYSNNAIAQKHKLSESTVRTLLRFDLYKVTFEQLGTGHRTTIDIAAPMGTKYEDVVAKVKKDLS